MNSQVSLISFLIFKPICIVNLLYSLFLFNIYQLTNFKLKIMQMKKLFSLFLLMMGTTKMLDAQIKWNFTAATPTGAIVNAAAGSVTQGNNNGTTTFLAAGTPASAVYTGFSAGNNGNFSAKTGVFNIGTSTYLQTTISPTTGFSINITGIKWGNFSLATTGPTVLSVYFSNDNFNTSSLVSSSTVTQSATAWNLLIPTITPYNGLASAPITIRIYASGGSGTTPAAAAVNWRVDDLEITASVQNGGSVTSTSVNTLNGFTGSVTNPTTTPAITIGTTVTGMLKGNGTAISAANAGTDYLTPTGSAAQLTSFPVLNQNTTGTAANVTGTVSVNNGGTGISTLAPGALLYGTGNNSMGVLASPSIGSYVLSSNGAGTAPNWSLPTTNSWGLVGNSGTDPGSNFIGTINNVGLMFKTNDIQSGYINLITNSTSFGQSSLPATSTGIWNTAFGKSSMGANTNGEKNTAYGHNSLALNTTGSWNAALGYESLSANTSGFGNVGVGPQSLYKIQLAVTILL
jgi:hypothetical protein